MILPSILATTARLALEQGHGADAGHAPKGGEIFTTLYAHVLAHPLGSVRIGGLEIPYYNLQLFQVLSMAIVFGLFAYALAGLKSGRPNRVQRVLTGFVLWIREEMVVPSLGKHHAHLLFPFFLTIFFFVTASNLIGIFPFTATSTACIWVTAGLSAITFLTMIVGGMMVNGPIKFWLGLVPHGIPLPLWPLMFVVEIIGLCVKPFALTIRLFANMTGGHLVVLSFMGLIFYFGEQLGSGAYGVAVPAVGFAVFIMIIESFVALLQAYIFTLLSLLFVGASLHPEH